MTVDCGGRTWRRDVELRSSSFFHWAFGYLREVATTVMKTAYGEVERL